MHETLRNWCDFMEGRIDLEEVDINNFRWFFDDIGYTEENKKAVFQYFPNSEQLIWGLDNCIGDNPLSDDYPARLSPKQATELAMNNLQEKRFACVESGEQEVLDCIDKVKPRVVDDEELLIYMRGDDPHSLYESCVWDHFYSHMLMTNVDHKYMLNSLLAAILDNIELEVYVKRPLVDTTMNVDNGFNLIVRSCDYCLTADELLVFVPDYDALFKQIEKNMLLFQQNSEQ